jgi:hypothetical protein
VRSGLKIHAKTPPRPSATSIGERRRTNASNRLVGG